MLDVIIIGKGPAGVSAGLYTARAGLKTLIIGKDSWLTKTDNIDNYYGLIDKISGSELLRRGEEQAKKFGVDIIDEEVVNVEMQDGFKVSTSLNVYNSRALLIATGYNRKKVDIVNIDRFEGKGVHYCTTCDGFFYRGKELGVIGNGDFAINEAMELLNFTNNITIFTNGKEVSISKKYDEAMRKFKINKNKIVRFEGKNSLQEIYFENGEGQTIDGIFVANEVASANDFARKLGIVLENDSIVVNQRQETNLRGIFSAGDCTNSFRQISVAVGQGAVAGKSIIEYIRGIK